MNCDYIDMTYEDEESLDLTRAFEDPSILDILEEMWNIKMLWTNPAGVLLFIYLHQRKEIKFIKIKDSITGLFKHTHILAFKDLGNMLSNNNISPLEKDDFEHGIKAYAFVADIRQDNPLGEIIPTIYINNRESSSIPLSFDTLYFLYQLMNENLNYKCFIEDYPPQVFADKIIEWSKDTKIDRFYSLESSFLRKELTKIISRLVSPKNKAILHPWAGPGSYIPLLHEDTHYIPIYQSKDDAAFGKVVAITYCHKKHEIHHEGDSDNLPKQVLTILEKGGIDCVLVDDINIPAKCLWNIIVETTKHKVSGLYIVKTNNLITDQYAPGTYMNEDYCDPCIGEYEIEKYISHVFYLPNGLSILLAPKEKKDTCNIIYVDETNNIFFNPKIFFENIRKKDKKVWHTVSIDKLYELCCRFDLNEFLSRNEREKIANEPGAIALETFFISDNLTRLENEPQFIFNDIFCNDYSKFLPYYKIDKEGDLVRISKEEAETPFFETKPFLYLIADLRNEKLFQPKILVIIPYVDDLGFLCALRMGKDVVFNDGIVTYRIDGEQIDCNFLISEMNKDYFIKQIFKVKKEYAKYDELMNRTNTFEECLIIIPDNKDSTTPLKRQRHYYNEEKLKFLKTLLNSFDYNIENIISEKAYALPLNSLIKDGRYLIVDNLGAGGFGIVYKAIDQETGKTVAIKEFFDNQKQMRAKDSNNVFIPIYNDIEEITDARNMFMREAYKIKDFSSSNIIKIYDVFDDNDTCYYSMEYINGCNLEEYIKSKGGLKESEAIKIIRHVAVALQEMHDHKMCHYDISPENIMLDHENNRIVLVDFGSAKTSADKSDIIYTKRLFSPTGEDEKFFASCGFYPKWDIYSLGATLYYIITGVITTSNKQTNGYESSVITKAIDKKKAEEKETVIFNRPVGMSDQTWSCIEKAVSRNRQKNIDEFMAMLPCE